MTRKPRKKSPRSGGRSTPTAVEQLIAMAAEPVPLASGYREFGNGPHCYVKLNPLDGSVRCFRFRRPKDARRAMAAGVVADTPPDRFAA